MRGELHRFVASYLEEESPRSRGSGYEALCGAVAREALRQYGPLSRDVFQSWGIPGPDALERSLRHYVVERHPAVLRGLGRAQAEAARQSLMRIFDPEAGLAAVRNEVFDGAGPEPEIPPLPPPGPLPEGIELGPYVGTTLIRSPIGCFRVDVYRSAEDGGIHFVVQPHVPDDR